MTGLFIQSLHLVHGKHNKKVICIWKFRLSTHSTDFNEIWSVEVYTKSY